MTAEASPTNKRQDNIDLLRALAILAVVAFHYTSRFPPQFYLAQSMPFKFSYGHFGVDLFFTVSGFCIFMTMERSATWQNFLARRIARIQPAYMVAVLLTYVVVKVGGLPGRDVNVGTVLSNLVWLDMIPGSHMVDGAYWSLLVELKFYLWVGLLFYLSRGRHISLRWAAFAAFGAMLGLLGGHLASIGDLLLIGPYAPSFLAGILAWEWPRLSNLERSPLAALTLALLLVSPRFHEAPALGPAIGVFAFLILRWPSLRVPGAVTYIGLISYSLYLLHQNIGYVVIRHLAPLPIELRIIAAFAAMVGLSAFSFNNIERRFEKWALRHAEPCLGTCRNALRIPYRQIANPTVDTEIRAW